MYSSNNTKGYSNFMYHRWGLLQHVISWLLNFLCDFPQLHHLKILLRFVLIEGCFSPQLFTISVFRSLIDSFRFLNSVLWYIFYALLTSSQFYMQFKKRSLLIKVDNFFYCQELPGLVKNIAVVYIAAKQ